MQIIIWNNADASFHDSIPPDISPVVLSAFAMLLVSVFRSADKPFELCVHLLRQSIWEAQDTILYSVYKDKTIPLTNHFSST
jgi:hypothetical protein